MDAQFARESAMLKLPEERGKYRKGYYFYSPQSSTVIKSKMAATTILRTRTGFRPPKIRLHCGLPYNIRVAHKPITTLRRLLTNVKDKVKTNWRTDREQYTRSNAATARLLTLVKPAETLARD